jgi:hypothetical protein
MPQSDASGDLFVKNEKTNIMQSKTDWAESFTHFFGNGQSVYPDTRVLSPKFAKKAIFLIWSKDPPKIRFVDPGHYSI